MKKQSTIREALSDPALLGHSLAGDTWAAWRTVLIAAMGEALTDAERKTFTQLTGRAREPGQRIEELVAVVGRRGGKSRSMATLAAYSATLVTHKLVPGETGVVLLIAPDQRQARIALDYALAVLESSPILAQLVESKNPDSITLTNRVSIEVRAASFRRLRGPTYVAVIADEAAFWHSDESANADVEILNAVRPGLATTGGPLIIASSPYSKRGVLWDVYRKHYGAQGDPLILVAQGASRDFNPSLPQSVVDRALERDYAAASAEYLAQFRNDLEAFVSHEIVTACIGDFTEAAPIAGVRYFAFVDPSGGSSDSMTLAIGHREDRDDGERIVVDAFREVRPPFSPEGVVDDFSELLKRYGVTTVKGDRYGGEWPREQFAKRAITYLVSEKTKSDLYRDLLPKLNSGQIQIPKSDRLVSQLCGLERRTARGGRDSIDHAPGGHDDLANAIAGVADFVGLAQPYHAFQRAQDGSWYEVGGRPKPAPLPYRPPNPEAFNQHQQRHAAKQTAWQHLARTLRG